MGIIAEGGWRRLFIWLGTVAVLAALGYGMQWLIDYTWIGLPLLVLILAVGFFFGPDTSSSRRGRPEE